jgi:hypothetical protein
MEGGSPVPAPRRQRGGPAARGARRPATAAGAAAHARPTARDLVTALWRDCPPADGSGGAGPRPGVDLQGALASLSVHAEALAVLAPGAAPDEAALLAQTARSLHAMLDLLTVGGGHDVLMRVARLERWLALRAQQEPAAQCAADLAMWTLEQLERTRRL